MLRCSLGLFIALGGCGEQECAGAGREGPNLLVIVADDVGVDKVGTYELPGAPSTPNIDALAASGVRFDHAWATPVCSPSRAALLTGRYPSRVGVGRTLYPAGVEFLGLEEVLIPEALCARPSAAIGKWHLGNRNEGEEGLEHPNRQGFDWFEGSLGNLSERRLVESDTDRGYYNWEKVTNGEVSRSTTYATTDATEAAIGQIERMTGDRPWFLYLAYHAAHEPREIPPGDLYRTALPGPEEREAFDQMVEAMDTEIGRLMQHIDLEETVVLFAGDNGTPIGISAPELSWGLAKGTPTEAGIRVPLVAAGAGVGTGRSDALVHLVDVFPTVLELASTDSSAEVDGQSFAAQLADPSTPGSREFVYTESFRPNFGVPDYRMRAIRERRYKLVVESGEGRTGIERLHDLEAIPWLDGPDLISTNAMTAEAARALDRLRTRLDDTERDLNGGCATAPGSAPGGVWAVLFAVIHRRRGRRNPSGSSRTV